MSRDKILVAIDASEPSRAALDFALRRANAGNNELLIAHAFDRGAVAARACGPYGAIDPYPLVRAVEGEANAVLASAMERAERANVPATSLLLEGPIVAQILGCAREHSVSTIVLGTHARSGLPRFALGSVAAGVLRASDVPAFIVPEGAIVTAALRTILVAIDGSEASIDASYYALDIAQQDQATVVFCSVVDLNVVSWTHAEYGHDPEQCTAEIKKEASAMLDQALEIARERHVPAQALLRCGNAYSEILEGAREVSADLIVVGTHGRTGLGRLFLGSVAESVIRQSAVPVCTIRPTPIEWHRRQRLNENSVSV